MVGTMAVRGDFNQIDVVAGLFILVAPLFLFFGEKLYKPVIFSSGFAGGYVAAFYVTDQVSQTLSAGAHIGIAVAAGIALGITLLCLQKVGVFIVGAVPGLVGGNLVFQLIASNTHFTNNTSNGVRIAVMVVCPLASGALTVYMLGAVLRVLTAFGGGYLFVAGVDHFVYRFGWKDTNPLDPSTFFRNTDQFRCTDNWCYALLASWAVLFIAGCIVQWRHAAKEEEEKESEYAALGQQNQNAYVGAAPIGRRAGNSAFVNHQVGGERDLKSPFISYR